MDSKTNAEPNMDMERATKIEKAVSQAVDLVRTFSERDPHDGDAENPWKDPQAMLDQLDQAREGIIAASRRPSGTTATKAVDPNDFRSCYMDLVTNAFADVLEDMRNNHSDEEFDVDVLVDCLQSGMDFLSGEEQEFLMMEDDDLDESLPTPHEARQLQLGLHVH